MARSDDGEFELILGNRQLISVFLIVVILLGVFFSMGYIVGRNSAPLSTDARNLPGVKPIVVEPPSRTLASPSPTSPAKDTEKDSTSRPTPTEPPRRTPMPVEKPAPVKREPAPVATPPEKKPEPPSERAAVNTVDEPPPGIYWQVAAAPRPQAEIVAGAIRRKGLAVVLASAPNTDLFRVLVGPLADASSAASARTTLEGAGFKNFIRKKY